MKTTRNISIALIALSVSLTAHGADKIAVVGNTLQAAKSAYKAATNLPRKDCDPVGGGKWVCASFTNPKLSDVQSPAVVPTPPIVIQPLPEPTPTPIPPVVVAPVTTPETPNTSGKVAVIGNSIKAARDAYAAATTLERVDCDRLSGGRWICASFKNPKESDAVSAPTVPVTPHAALEPEPEPPLVVEPEPESPIVKNGGINTAYGNANIQKLSVKLDNTYRYNANGPSAFVTFQHPTDGLKQLWSFVKYPESQMFVAIRDFPSGQFSDPVSVHGAAMGNTPWEQDNHNYTAVSVAGDGTVFVTGNHHVDELRMAKSKEPWSITGGFTKVQPSEIPGNRWKRVTYPTFGYADGYTFLSYRDQIIGSGNSRFAWIIVRYNHVSGKWDNFSALNSGTSLRLYASNLAHSENGRLHITGLFRDDRFSGGAGTQSQRDLFHLYSDNLGKSWKQYGLFGDVKLPLWWNEWNHNWDGGNDNPKGNDVQQLIWDTPRNGSGGDPIPNDAGSIATDSNGYPHILNDERPGTLWYHRYNGNRWVSIKTPFDSNTDHPFSMGNGKMGALVHRGSNIYFHSLDPNDQSYKNGVLLAAGYANNNNNSVVDQIAIKAGWLSTVIMQANSQKSQSGAESNPQDGWMLSIPIDQLEGFKTPFRK